MFARMLCPLLPASMLLAGASPLFAADPCAAGSDGIVALTLALDDRGRPTDCRVARSSGGSQLDAASCKVSLKRMRFRPARDAEGHPVASTFDYTVHWRCSPAPAPATSLAAVSGTMRSVLDLPR